MTTIPKYNTYVDYPNQTGFNQIAYPLRDAILIINPFFVVLFGLFSVLTVASYYTFVSFVGRTRLFNSMLAAAFSTTIVSFFFSLAGWITPLHVMTWIAITILLYITAIFYR